MLSLCACSKITHPHALLYKPLLDSPDFSSFCSTPPTATPTSMLLTGIRTHSCASPLEEMQSGYLDNSFHHTGYEPNICINVSSEHTLINHPSRKNSFNFENDLTTTVAASENSDRFPQRSAASGSQQPVPANVVTMADVKLSPVQLCHVLLCHLCICVHFRSALESQGKRWLHILSSHRGCTDCPLRTQFHIDSGAG